MRSQGPEPEHLAPWIERVAAGWRRFLGLSQGVRLALVAGLVALLAAGYWLAPTGSSNLVYVFGGHAFAPDQVATAQAVLSGVPVRKVVVESRRILVPADQLLPAQTALKKARLDPRSFDEIVEGLSAPHFFEDLKARDARVDGARAALAEHLIEQMPGIADAKVHFIPLPASGASRKHAAKVLIDLRTDSGAPPSYRTVRDARDLALSVSDYVIRPEDVTLTGCGRRFLIASDRGLLRQVLTAAKEEEWTEEVLSRLRDIRGVRVSVGLSAPDAWSRGGSRPRINEPVDVEAEAQAHAEAQTAETAQATVSVGVPRVYYQRLASARGAASYIEDRERTEARIEEVIRGVLPPTRLAAVTIDVTDQPIEVPAPPVDTGGVATSHSWWVPAAAGSVLGAAALLCVARLREARGPASRPSRRAASTVSPRWPAREDHAHGADVADRVRHMVRRNPEVAAEVVRRWVGQEGPAS
jgi:hypothetical protein